MKDEHPIIMKKMYDGLSVYCVNVIFAGSSVWHYKDPESNVICNSELKIVPPSVSS